MLTPMLSSHTVSGSGLHAAQRLLRGRNAARDGASVATRGVREGQRDAQLGTKMHEAEQPCATSACSLAEALGVMITLQGRGTEAAHTQTRETEHVLAHAGGHCETSSP